MDWQLANPAVKISTAARMGLGDGSPQAAVNKVQPWHPFTMSILLEEAILSRCFNCRIFFWGFSTRKCW